MAFYRQELLPERRDIPSVSGYGSRIRRGKRLGKITRRRCTIMALLPAVLFLLCLSFFSRNLTFNSSYLRQRKQEPSEKEALDLPNTPNLQLYSENMVNMTIGSAEGAETTTTIVHQNPVQLEIPKNTKNKHHKQHGRCEINFAESVNSLVEAENYMNYTHFLLEYVSIEEKTFEHDIYNPRFGGHQTLEEREDSFYARNQTLHCGFVKGSEESESAGFDIDMKDKSYMHTCKVVVSSCIFGSSDFLRRPTRKKISGYTKKHVCFVMFLDELTLEKLFSEGQIPDDRGYIGLWRTVIVRNLPYMDMRKTGKVPKFLSHRLFPSSRFSIWIDSKMRLNADPMLILEYFLWRKQSEYAISNHYDRHCVWDEVIQNKRLNKYNHTAIDEQFIFYQSDGLIKFNESDENAPLPSYVPEGSFIVRAHTPMSNLFSCLWFNEVHRFTSRDQLSFAYTYLKLRRMNPGKQFFLNMFMDCERRALARLFHHRAEYPPPFTAV